MYVLNCTQLEEPLEEKKGQWGLLHSHGTVGSLYQNLWVLFPLLPQNRLGMINGEKRKNNWT